MKKMSLKSQKLDLLSMMEQDELTVKDGKHTEKKSIPFDRCKSWFLGTMVSYEVCNWCCCSFVYRVNETFDAREMESVRLVTT